MEWHSLLLRELNSHIDGLMPPCLVSFASFPLLMRYPISFIFLSLLTTNAYTYIGAENIISFLALSPNFHNYHLACVTYPIFTIKWKSPLKYLVIHLSDICYVPMSKLLFFFDIHLVGNTLMHLRCKHHGALEALAISSDLPFSQRWVSWLNSSLNSI